MVYMLSKYSDDLEGVVQERTEMLLEEQKKTDALLEQMLPRLANLFIFVCVCLFF